MLQPEFEMEDLGEAKVTLEMQINGYVFSLYGTAVSRKSTHQPVVALSTTEAEFVAERDLVSIWRSIKCHTSIKVSKLS